MSRNHIVALVDDDLAVLASLKFLLDLAGYNVAAYSSAMAFLNDGGSGAACLIVDQHMPHMTGLELAARLRADGASIPVLLVTGLPSAAIAARAAELGIEGVLEKPPNERDLLRFIDAHC